MKGIDTSTAVPDMFGSGAAGFRDGDPLSGTPATRLNAGWFNSVQQELLNAITDAGLSPDANDLTQLAQAIRSRVGKHVGEVFHYPGRTPPFGAVVADGGLVRRDMYPDLWKFAQDQNMVIAETAWQTQSTSQGSVGMYSAGDGVTTFRLPLLTDFFRGTKDPEKVGTWQGDAIRDITGSFDGYVSLQTSGGAMAVQNFASTNTPAPVISGSGYHGLNFVASRVVPTASENRPKTLFLLPCIHAYNAVIPDAQADMHALLLALNDKLDKTTYNTCPIFHGTSLLTPHPANVSTRIPVSSIHDTHNSLSGGSFKPTVPGYYMLTAHTTYGTSHGAHRISMLKPDGSGVDGALSGIEYGSVCTAILYLDGATPVSPYAYVRGASSIAAGGLFFTAFLVRGA